MESVCLSNRSLVCGYEFVTHIWNPYAYGILQLKIERHTSTVNPKSINPPVKMNKANDAFALKKNRNKGVK